MTRIGISILVVGMVMLVGSCFLFGFTGIRASEANKALTVPIEPNKSIKTDLVNVDTGRLCSISVRVKVRSSQVYTIQERDPNSRRTVTKYHLKYTFPIRYRVLDAAGNVLHEQSERIDPNAGVRSGLATVDNPEGGVAEVEHYFAKFKVADPGRIQVEATLENDTQYGAKMESASLIVYDNVSRHTGTLVTGFFMMCFSPVVVVVGAFLTLVGLIKHAAKHPTRFPPPGAQAR
jgi:hypothetical protein